MSDRVSTCRREFPETRGRGLDRARRSAGSRLSSDIDRGSPGQGRPRARGRPPAGAVAFAVAVLLCAAFLVGSVPSSETTPAPDRATVSYTVHPVIYIQGNAQFNNTLYPANGVVAGNGTASDPYIIQGWEIESGYIGITIRETTDHFVVRDCLIRPLEGAYVGIQLYSVANGVLEGNNCSGHSYGMRLDQSSGCSVVNNTCDSNSGGGVLIATQSHNGSITGNSCRWNAGPGVLITQSPNCSVTGNDLDHNSYGVVLSESPMSTLSNNSCSWGQDSGIIVSNSGSSVLTYNTADSNRNQGVVVSSSPSSVLAWNEFRSNGQMGIILQMSNNATLLSNTCTDSAVFGIYVSSTRDAALTNNTCSGNDLSGVYLGSSSHNAIVGNRVSENLNGVFIYSSSHNELQLNTLENQTSWGVRIEYESTGNTIWNNTFTGNNPGSAQAVDNSTGNRWNTSGDPHGYGNHWSDWTGPDDDSDGVVDDPYAIAGTAGAMDSYPLTDSPTVPIPEFGLLPAVVLALLAMVLLGRRAGRGSKRIRRGRSSEGS